ncbi:CBS domain-containing protein (plasmid) [Deinococcus sp. KNUC1210]|uniref:CBS domain-containing protein n=1 Tax=Deinococcus sp. KNUC1210 TaxID=2917691 RepID=UPI001EF05BD9|nr:CBS domain-containing protein [Deinococcus sp. KNUC1210]ULH17665.1 CBS domain-containing protein [Deinococcus sp. KNUC1210]
MLVRDAMHGNTVTIQSHHSLPDAVVMMETLKVRRLPVMRQSALVGLLSDGDIKRRLPALHDGLTPWEFTDRAARVKVSEAMCPVVLTTTPGTHLETAIELMLDRRVGGLPVLDGGELVGMLTLTDVLRAAVTAPRDVWKTVREQMTEQVVAVPADAPASEAAATLKVTRLRVLPVTEQGQLVGVIHQTDIEAAVERRAAPHGDTLLSDQFFLNTLTARDLMRPPADQVIASMPMRDAVTKMFNSDVHGLPVISSSGKLLGVVTISDVLKTLLGRQEARHS